jgi:choline dehydrogenase-like flavoprotein
MLAAGLDQAGLGRLELTAEPALNPNAHHHAGTTRMGAGPVDGVVDPDLRVHGADNLFVCGSSVFPTAGAVNPTLTAVALAHRLADHLRSPTDESGLRAESERASRGPEGG